MFEDERHPCAYAGCQHEAEFADEAFCFYHEPPVSPHDCVREGCASRRG